MSSGIYSANACVGKLLDGDGPRDERDSGLRGPYKILKPAQKFDIGKRAAEIGTTAAMRYYAKSYPHLDLKETSIRRFKNHYQTQLKTSAKEISGSSTVQELVPKKRGRPLMVSEGLDEQVREHIRELRKLGVIINAYVVISAGMSLVLNKDAIRWG